MVKSLSCVVFYAFLCLTCIASNALAQSTQVTGIVSDTTSGEAIPAVEVYLQGSDKKAITNNDGRYFFRNVTPGNYQISVNTIGYQSWEDEIQVEGEQMVVQDIGLGRLSDEGDRIFNKQYMADKANGLNRQQTLGTFNWILSPGQINRFSAYSVQDALRRVPGAQTSREGAVNLRGVGFNRYYVTLDGQRLASTVPGLRTTDLGAISTDMIRELEVINVLRPDLDADGLAGVVNLITRRPAVSERELSVQVGGGANTNYFNRTGPSSQFSVSLSEPLLENLTLVVDAGWQMEQAALESLDINYSVADFGNGPVDVLEQVSPGLQTDSRGRLGGRIQITYEPDYRTQYYFQGMITRENRERVGHHDTSIANGDWINQTETGEEGDQGSYGHDGNLKDIDTQLISLQAGGEKSFDQLDLDYRADWSRGSYMNNEYSFPFRIEEMNHSIDMENRARPQMEVTNFRLQEDGTIDRQFIILQDVNRIFDDQVNDQFSARIDATIPFGAGEFQLGTKAQHNSKRGDYRDASFDLNRTFRLVRFNVIPEPNRDVSVFEPHYTLPWLLNTSDARSFFESQMPTFSRLENQYHRNSDYLNYNAREKLLAGYGMGTFQFGKLWILGGVRAEYMDANYEGRITEFDDEGEFINNEDRSIDSNRLDLFPHLNIGVEPTGQTGISAAYSRTIRRPDYHNLSPFQVVDQQNTNLFRGNPELDPVLSDNLDLSLAYYFSDIGIFSVNAFAKQIKDFIYIEEQSVESGEFSGFTEQSYQNSDYTASLYGVEVSLDKQLTFLPGFLKHFGTYANYTWTQSRFETDREEETDLPGQSPHAVNLSLDYNWNRYMAQISYHWTATALHSLRENRTLAPSISESEEVYRDTYQDGLSDLSLSFRFRISEQFRFWLNAHNLIGGEWGRYSNTRRYYPEDIQMQGGREFRLGIRYNL